MPISQSTIVLAGGARAIQLTVPFAIPQEPDSGETFDPRVSHLDRQTASTGGTLLGNKIYCYFLVALKSGKRSKPSRTIEVLVPAGTNTNTITISGEKPFDDAADQYEVYRSEDDVWNPRRILAPTAIPAPFTFTDTGLSAANVLPTDNNYAGARVYWRRQGDTYWNLGAETSDKTQTSLTFAIPYNQQGLVIELQLRAVTRSGKETPPVVAPTTTFALTAVPQQIDLDIGAVDGATGIYARTRAGVLSDGRVRFLRTSGGADLDVDDSAKRAFDALDETAGKTYVRGDPYHSSAVREPATVARTGNTSSASFVTVAQFDIELSPVQSSYKAKNLTVSVAGGVRPSQSSGAGSASNVAGAGVDWANPSNALGSDDAYATAALGAGGGSDYLRIDFSGFSIPGGAVLKGFELTIERSKTGSGDIEDNSIRLHESGTAVGNDKFASGVLWPGPDTDAVYGGQGDLWNISTISVADLNNGIVGCLIQAAETGGVSAATARIDAVTLRVYYDEFVAEARVKIGAQVSSVLSLTGPSTSAGPVDRDVTGLTPGSTITVEVQGRMVTGSGTVTAAIDQKRMTPQHRDHFVV